MPYTSKAECFKVLNDLKDAKDLNDVKTALRVVAGKSIHNYFKPSKTGFMYQISHKEKLHMIRREVKDILNTPEVRDFLTKFMNI